MDGAEIQRRILDYLDHLEDVPYFADIVSRAGVGALNDRIVELLRSGEGAVVGTATLFIRDLVLLAPRDAMCAESTKSYLASPVVGALERLATAPHHQIRRHAIYTLGKTGCRSSLAVLHQAFHALFEKDPILLPTLVGEIFWPEEKDSLNLVEEVLASRQYLTRWAVFEILERIPFEPDRSAPEWQLRSRICSQLVRDPSAVVRAEAEYRQARLHYLANSRPIPRAERRLARSEIEHRRPSFCFSNLETAFKNYLYHQAAQDYTVSELDDFVQQQIT